MISSPLQWHPGFFAVIQIELQEDADNLEFESEHELTKKPLRVDTLIVKKLDDKPIRKNIGRIFKKYNLIEYKSPDDSLSINDFYKVYGYACLYQSDTEHVREIAMSDVTVTFVCSHYPREMLKCLKEERGITVRKREKGIYLLENEAITMQIILANQLSEEENRWLSSLRTDLQLGEETNRLLKEYEAHKDSNIYQAAMDLIARANHKMMEEAKDMCEALRELFADELEEREAKGKELGKEIGENRLSLLLQKLFDENLLEDVKKVSEDKAYREQMYLKYGL